MGNELRTMTRANIFDHDQELRNFILLLDAQEGGIKINSVFLGYLSKL